VRFNSAVFSLTVLGSGSSGNCSLIATDECKILVDAGFSARQICRRLESIRIAPESLDAVIVTHEHSDHMMGLDVFGRRFGIPVFTNPLTAETIRRTALPEFDRWHLFETGAGFAIKDVEIQSFYVPHDAVDPMAFVFTSNDGAIGYLTDLGYAPKLVLERIRAVHTLFVETNHDERLLQADTKRPWSVKQRILSRHGHLSNEAAGKLVAEIAGHNLERVVLGHLSRDCNRPEIALETVKRYGTDRLEYFCADQQSVSATFTVARIAHKSLKICERYGLVVQEQIDPVHPQCDAQSYDQSVFNLGWHAGHA
jgi:phosphoribosyl 1,2-cyclic phosphodiesterase